MWNQKTRSVNKFEIQKTSKFSLSAKPRLVMSESNSDERTDELISPQERHRSYNGIATLGFLAEVWRKQSGYLCTNLPFTIPRQLTFEIVIWALCTLLSIVRLI
jgi:hypothetical protein